MNLSKYRKKVLALFLLLPLSFIVGMAVAAIVLKNRPQEAVQASANGNWGLSFQTEGAPPVANAAADQLAKYNACYAEMTDEKVLYLTFDAGYENGNTAKILDALKKHQVPATFFVVGNYLETSPDLVKRMVDEGHFVGNHTYHHPDMSKISSKLLTLYVIFQVGGASLPRGLNQMQSSP